MADISITAANVLSTNTSPPTITLGAGVTATQGVGLYRLSDGTAGLADSNATTPANSFIGIALSAGSPGQVITYVPQDSTFTLGASGLSIGPIYVSNTAGKFTQALGDLASGSTLIVIGVAISTTQINLNPATGLTGGTT